MKNILCHSRAACVVGALAPYNHGVPLAGAGGNPAVLFNMPLGFVLAAQGSLFINWIPACAGMTANEVTA
jgi:hypothetical protein